MRLVLIRHAPSASTRRAAFSLDEPLDEAGTRQAAKLPGRLTTRIDRWLASESRVARGTAEAAGVRPELDPDLNECNFGLWAGSTLAEVEASNPDGLRAWFEDPEATPHEGESIAQLILRVRGLLERVARSGGTTAALTHAGVVRAAVVVALDAPTTAFWRIDVAPLSFTELHTSDYGWRLALVNGSGA